MINGRDIALTGVPRSGTTLSCRLLGQAADTVSLFEPMEVHRLPSDDRAAALQDIRTFFHCSRQSLLAEGVAHSQQSNGQVPDNPFESLRDNQGLRRRQATLGTIKVDKPLTAGFTLVVKHNAAFTALLPELIEAFDTYAVIRNPLSVLASWNSVDLPVAQGRMPAGERFDPVLAARLDGAGDRVERQLVALDWLFSKFSASVPPKHIVSYEAIVATGGHALAEATGVAVPPLSMSSRNASALYDPEICRLLAQRLRCDGGAWRAFYGDEGVEAVLDQMLQGQ